MRLHRFNEWLSESIKTLNQRELFQWLEQRADATWIFLDTETTGLRGPREEQLTQVAAVAYRYDPQTMGFEEIDHFNEKCRLNPEILAQLDAPGSRIRDVFKFTRYEINQEEYRDEQEVLDALQGFVDQWGKVVLLIQNAPFDIPMINVRKRLGGLRHEIFDTKEFYAYFLLPTLQRLAETEPDAAAILQTIGTTASGRVPTSSLPKVAGGLGISAEGAHDALFDCRYGIEVLQKALQIVREHSDLDLKAYRVPRISVDRHIKLKNKGYRP